MNRPGTGPQPLRSTPGNVYGSQQPTVAPRAGTLGSGRLPNGKLAAGTGWGFAGGVGAAGTPGPQSSQPRSTNSNISSFAQTIGSSQSPHTPLDLSEFPSLSGAPQSQQQSAASQAIWGNPGIRAPQNTTVLRTMNPSTTMSNTSHTIRPPSQPSHTQSHRQTEAQDDSRTSPFPQLGAGSDDFSFGQNGNNQAIRDSDRQGASEEFPPLGGLGVAGPGQMRRTGMPHDLHMNGSGNADAFGSMPSQSRAMSSRLPNHHQDHLTQTSGGDGRFPPMDTVASRSNLDTTNGDQESLQGHDQSMGERLSQVSGEAGFSSSQLGRLPFRQAPGVDQQQERFSQPNQHNNSIHNLNKDSQPLEQPPTLSMTETEIWGIKGLQARLDGAYGPDQAALAHGMDLNMLGLDLNRAEPLHTDWAGPFADPNGRPVIPDFTLPVAYTVHNVPPLHEKIGSFSDETLFIIFYQNPRDESQDLAAQELYQRDWRWHKKLQQWMMKAKEFGEPVMSSTRQEERGVYYFWNANEWRRDRREFILSYEHLHHAQGPQGVPSL